MEIKNYINFDDKANSVRGIKVVSKSNDIDSIFNQFDNFYKKRGYVFRGINEAAYKMLSSFQRYWANNDLKLSDINYTDSIFSELEKAKVWSDELLQKYLAKFGKNYENNNIAYFSIMQHNRVRTPLLDFTYNPFIALFFACENSDSWSYDENLNDIRNFFSLYFIYFDWLLNKNFTKIVTDINKEEFLHNNVYQLANNELIYNNLNIIAQEGLFLINTSPELDLISLLKLKDTSKEQRFFGCYNIHKSLAEEVRGKLKKKGITKELLFPDVSKMLK